MKEKILSDQIVRGTWYKTNGRVELIQAIQELISENVCIEFNTDKSLFRKTPNDLFEWAHGREDCHVVTRPYQHGKVFYDLYQGDKLISIR